MSNRRSSTTPRQPGIPSVLGAHGWTTFDYMLTAGLTWSLMAASPVLLMPPWWIALLAAPSD